MHSDPFPCRALTPHRPWRTPAFSLGNETGLVAYYTFGNSAQDVTHRGSDGMLMGKESFVDTTLSAAGVCAVTCWHDSNCATGEWCNDLTPSQGKCEPKVANGTTSAATRAAMGPN